MSGTSLAVKIGTLVLGVGVLLVLFKRIKGLKKYGWGSLIYVLVVALLLALPTLFLLSGSSHEIRKLILAQIIIIALGSLHVWQSKKLLPWYDSQIFIMQIVFLICMLLFGFLFSNLSFTFLVSSQAQFVWSITLLWFLVPILLNRSVEKLLEVPQKEFKKWQYPLGETIEDPSDEEMENPVVISFEFFKSCSETELTTFRAKAPVGMSLGRLFYFFINDYNSRNPEDMIAYIDEKSKKPEHWIFYKQKNKFLNTREALDPDDSIYANNIKENDVLICTRFFTKETTENETTE